VKAGGQRLSLPTSLRRPPTAAGLRSLRLSGSYAGYRVANRLAPLLPRTLAYPLADRLGDAFWLFNRAARRAVRDNLRHVLGQEPPTGMIRQVFRHGARNYYDTFLIPTLTRAGILELIPVQGWANLDRALASGRGAIMVGVHLSSVALGGQVVAAKGYRVTTVVEPVEPPGLMQLLTRLRSGGGVRVLPLGPELVKELLAALRRNEVIGLVMDRDIAGTGVPVEFFGAEANLPGGAALLALRTGAPILPAVAIRTTDERFAGYIDAPVEVERGLASVRRTTRKIAQRFERHIAAHPEQWTVYEPVWRRRPKPAKRRSAV
jgi:lauroyl/myristoyl acyltransferase